MKKEDKCLNGSRPDLNFIEKSGKCNPRIRSSWIKLIKKGVV